MTKVGGDQTGKAGECEGMSHVKLRDKARKDRLKPNYQGSRILYLGIRISIFRLLRVNLYSYLKTNFIDNNKGFGDKKKKGSIGGACVGCIVLDNVWREGFVN